jgi:hypothetical protein
MKLLTEDASGATTRTASTPVARLSARGRRKLRADVERTCGSTPGPAEALAGAVSYRVKPYLLFPWAADLVRNPPSWTRWKTYRP